MGWMHTWLFIVSACMPPAESEAPPAVPVAAATADTGGGTRDWPCFSHTRIYEDDRLASHRFRVYDPDYPERLLHEEEDPRNNGQLSSTRAYTYNDAGLRLSHVFDDFADGRPEHLETWAYDDGGRELRYTDDADADGILETDRSRAYDKDGNLVLETYDTNGDGAPDLGRQYTWTDARLTAFADDFDGNDTYEIQYTVGYDAVGRVTGGEGVDRDGVVVYRWVVRYWPVTGRDDWVRQVETVDRNADDLDDRHYEWVIDGDDRVREASFDEDGDGVFERRWYERTFDGAGRLTGQTFDDWPYDTTGVVRYRLQVRFLRGEGDWEVSRQTEVFLATDDIELPWYTERQTTEYACDALVEP